MQPCGDAEQASTLVRSECRLPPFMGDRIVAAANVGSPTFVSTPGFMLRLARRSRKRCSLSFAVRDWKVRLAYAIWFSTCVDENGLSHT